MAWNKKSGKSPSGTYYTQQNDSLYFWDAPRGRGTIILKDNGETEGTYTVYKGASVPDEVRPLQDQNILKKHRQNIEELQKSDDFVTDKDRLKDLLKVLKNKAASYLDIF